MDWLGSFISTMFDGIWGLYSLPFPGFDFTFGHLFLAVFLSSGALTLILRLCGVPILNNFSIRGGNNRNIKISKERSNDNK